MPSRAVPLLVLAGFSLLTLAVFRPTLSEVAHTAPAFHGFVADALLLMWATSHVSRAFFADPLHLFEAGIYHPARHTLAFGDHMIGQALVGLPVWLATKNPVLEYNVLALASYALGASAMFLYARETIGGVAAGLAAGLVFAFTPFRFHSPLWLQVLFTPFMPLALLFWLRFLRTLAAADWALWVVCWVAHSLMGMYLALYFGVTMTILALYALVAAPRRRERRLRLGVLLAPVATLCLLAPTLWPYLALRASQGHVREVGLDTHLNFFLPGPGTLSGRLAGLEGYAQFGPGLVIVLLGVLGAVAGWQRQRVEGSARHFLWQVHALGLGVTLCLILLPIRVQLAVPGLDMVRNTDRAFFVSLLFIAAFVGEAVAWLATRVQAPRLRMAVAVGLLAALVVDMGTPPRERKRLPLGREVPPAYGWLHDLPPDQVVYEQVNGAEAMALAMYFAIFHQKRLVDGYSGFTSPGAGYLTQELYHFPEPAALRLLDRIGVGHVLSHFATQETADAAVARLAPSLAVAARFGTDVVFAVRGPAPAPVVADLARPLPRQDWRLAASSGNETLPALRDGDRVTAWRGAAVPGESPPWLVVDLGGLHPISGVRCVPRRADAPGVYLAEVDLSADAATWTPTGARFVPDSLATLLDHPADLAYYEARFPTRPARYVRLRNPALAFWGGPWEIAELDVLEDGEGSR